MRQTTKQAQQKTRKEVRNMQNQQPQQPQLNIVQTCQPNQNDSLYLYLRGNGLDDLTICVNPADPTDLNAKSSLIFPYLKTERTALRLTYPCLEITAKEITAICLFTYTKKLIYDKDAKKVLQRFTREGLVSKDICAIIPYDGRYYPFIIEGFRTKLNAVKSFLTEKRQRGLLHPLVKVKHVMAKNLQGLDYPTFVIEVLEEHNLTEQEQKLCDALRGHFQWRLGLQPFSPLYPPELKQAEPIEDTDLNGDEDIPPIEF